MKHYSNTEYETRSETYILFYKPQCSYEKSSIAFHKNGNKSKIISHKRKTFIQCQICLVTVNYFSKDLNMIFPLELYRMKLAKNII